MTNFEIKCLKSETIESGSMYGQFLINSLNSGQGITIGNLLRRILLNDIPGITITGVRIAGIRDEFSVLKGVREDILEILLNLKGVILKNTSIEKLSEIQFGRLKIKGPTVVTANLIQLPPGIEVVNPNHYIATLSRLNFLEIELKLEFGTNYKLASETFSNKSEDFLQIDAVFMPIQKVNFKIENVYDNLNNVTERLFIEIWTNGSIRPEDALSKAAKFAINIFEIIFNYKYVKKPVQQKRKKNLKFKNPHTNIAIEELHLSVRAYNCLKRANINTIGDLLEYSPEKLQELKNFGRKSADEVFTTLKNKLGIILK